MRRTLPSLAALVCAVGCTTLLELEPLRFEIVEDGGDRDEGGVSDARDLPDAAADADGPGGPLPWFGETCPPGTTFGDRFDETPIGKWTTAVGDWAHDPAGGAFVNTNTAGHAVAWIGPRAWTSYVVSARIRVDAVSAATREAGLVLRVGDIGAGDGSAAPPNNAGAMYYVGLTDTSVLLGFMENGNFYYLTHANRQHLVGQWYAVSVSLDARFIDVFVDGALAISYTHDRYAGGAIGLRAYRAAASFDDVVVTCL